MVQLKPSNTGLVYYSAPGWSLGSDHPECEERLQHSYHALRDGGIFELPQLSSYKPRAVSDTEIARTHIFVPGILAHVYEPHRLAAGGLLVLADALMRGEIEHGYALVRPPGHHAMRIVHGNRGFCTINNIALLVQYLRSQYKVRKIAIVDTDVHHGDGTQDIFYHDPDVLVIGLHQDGRTLYPGTGFTDELGGPFAFARNLNVPLAPGTGDEGYHYVLKHLIKPVLDEFQPDILLQSAGLDNHFTDQLAMMKVTAQGYAEFVRALSPDLVVLEGGYAIRSALPYMNLAMVLALAGEDFRHVVEPDLARQDLRQRPGVMTHIARTVDKLIDVWQHPERIRAKAYPKVADVFARDKHIYYDTDGIVEAQEERIRRCDACAGWLSIQSEARGQGLLQRVWTMTLPYHACERCRSEAMAAYGRIKYHDGDALDWAVLQDLPADEISTYDFRTANETLLTGNPR